MKLKTTMCPIGSRLRSLAMILFLGVASAGYAHADDHQPCDDDTVQAVAQWAHVKGDLISRDQAGGTIAAASCKRMPNAPDVTIAAIAFDNTPDSAKSADGDHIQQVIALLKDNKVIAANGSAVDEDAASHFGSYRIDTAPYQLATSVRAFGVVFISDAHGASCPDADASEELTLWIGDGKDLRPVFGTNLYGWVIADKPFCASDVEGARSQSAHMTIAVQKTSSHGFADLAIAAHITESTFTHGKYVDTDKGTVRRVLKYDGKSYGIDMFRTFWYPASSPMSSAKAAD